ncbi:DUF7683 domain-containing protein [Bathymodiolus septemdierum thioautotrophic gill symbiont]|uniref:DUF7683 domain-containing protein n=1 Tax=endosymbiont of Bathymodiolus septemdierum str. Myojin knoll TaxID=1303921 RepID=A0A0N7KBH4_9GAMM|nr:hypothetical protein [Bathymodiolus septemdierum thioautotrophic gill symbiont]BAS68023.1 hypothetical protein BSEPE_1032 [endosymbiont of Bathymodiolus septemdierum str. Myojin knoll]
MSNKIFEFKIEVFWLDEKKYGEDLIEEIYFYDRLETMIKIVDPDLDDLEFVGGVYRLNDENKIRYFEKKLSKKLDLKKYQYFFERYGHD